MAISGGWLIPFMKDNYPDVEYGIIPLPAGKQKGDGGIHNGLLNAEKSTTFEQESWQLLNYLVSKEGME